LLFNLLLHISRRGGCAVDVGAEREPSAQGNANIELRRNHGVGEIKTQKAAISQAATSVRGDRKEHGTNDLRTCCNSVFWETKLGDRELKKRERRAPSTFFRSVTSGWPAQNPVGGTAALTLKKP